MNCRHLGVFFFVVLIVIIGSAQGFCLAFGTDIAGFRDPFQATINVALFTVGKFNYDELVWSQRWLGPLLYVFYIQNERFRTKNDDFVLKMKDFVLKMMISY